MTTKEFRETFERQVGYYNKRFPDLQLRRLQTIEVQQYLRDAEQIFIKRKLNSNVDDIDNTQRHIDEIKELFVKNEPLTLDGTLTVDPTRYSVYTLPENYLYKLLVEVNTTYCGTIYKRRGRVVANEKIDQVLNHSYTKTKFNSTVCEFINDKIYIYNDGKFTLNSVDLSYIRNIVPIDLFQDTTSELNPSVHLNIVEIAVNSYLERVDPQRFRTTIDKNQISEQLV